MKRILNVIITLLFLINSSFVQAQISHILFENDICNFKIIDENVLHTGSDAYIRKVTDGNQIYILKQICNASLDEQFLLINDCIASTIGYELGININKVFFIPYTVASHLKMYPDRAATLHVIIPGNDLEQSKYDFFSSNFTLHQRVINQYSFWQKQYPLADDQQGLTKDIIESMSFHAHLPPIVALDTFVGNGDRSEPNIFYDKETHCFWGIDQAAAFSKKLAFFACQRLKELMLKNYFSQCPSKIINGLLMYRDTLLHLKDVIQPYMIIENMQQMVPYLSYNALENDRIQERIKYHNRIMSSNYNYILELIELLNQIFTIFL